MKALLLILALFTLNAHADSGMESDYLCRGTDLEGRALTIKYDNWADNRHSARADVTFDVAGIGPRTTVDLYVWGGDEDGGADFGVTSQSGDWMIKFYLPPNAIEGHKVMAVYFSGPKFRTVNLACEATKF